MTAGALRHRVKLEAVRQTPDDTVGAVRSYAVVAEVWAEVRGVRDAVFAEGVQTGNGLTHSIRLRWRARHDFDHVSGDFGRRWKVLGVRDPDSRRRWLDVMARELTPEEMA